MQPNLFLKTQDTHEIAFTAVRSTSPQERTSMDEMKQQNSNHQNATGMVQNKRSMLAQNEFCHVNWFKFGINTTTAAYAPFIQLMSN